VGNETIQGKCQPQVYFCSLCSTSNDWDIEKYAERDHEDANDRCTETPHYDELLTWVIQRVPLDTTSSRTPSPPDGTMTQARARSLHHEMNSLLFYVWQWQPFGFYACFIPMCYASSGLNPKIYHTWAGRRGERSEKGSPVRELVNRRYQRTRWEGPERTRVIAWLVPAPVNRC
jgi:hypothetical protein